MIPITLLFLELVATCYLCFRDLRETHIGYSAYLPLIITNLGVTNVGTIGANQFMKDEMKQECGEVASYYKETDKFIKISSIMSFIHHSVVIATIVGLITYNPCYFQHWTCPRFILNNYKGYLYDHMYCVAVGIIGLGLFGLQSTLFLGARSLKILKREYSAYTRKWGKRKNKQKKSTESMSMRAV